MKSLKVPEKAVLKAVKEYLDVMERLGRVVWWTRMQSGALKIGSRYIRMSREGTPDIHGLLKGGRPFYIEVKGSDGKASPGQLEVLGKLREAGALAFIAHDVDFVEKTFSVIL